MSHISFSALKLWNECPYKYKLNYIDKIKSFEGNLYTAFGSAMHTVCEKTLLKEWKQSEAPKNFKNEFFNEVEILPENVKQDMSSKMFEDMIDQGVELAPLAIPFLNKFFEDYKITSSEEQLYEPIEGEEIKFKGFIDLALKTSDGKYHIIDWKTCSWGWDFKRKSDPMTTYQLTLYKYFFCIKHGIDPKNVETYFALLKRTAKKNHVEIFRVTSGPKKTNNALALLNKALFSIKKGFYPKNRLSCMGTRCEFYKTEHCK